MIEDKLVAFESCDENIFIYDRLLYLFNEYGISESIANDKNRFLDAFSALTGINLAESVSGSNNDPRESSGLDLRYWYNQFMPVLLKLATLKNCIPLEKNWTTIADLMFPDMDCWGYRGDPYLWRELRQALARVPVPNTDIELQKILQNIAEAIINSNFSKENGVFVNRFSYGGMSSGWVSYEFWTTNAIPEILQRAQWIRKAWRH